MDITDEQYCVYIMLSCGSIDNITILNVPGRTTRAPFTRQRLGLPHELSNENVKWYFRDTSYNSWPIV